MRLPASTYLPDKAFMGRAVPPPSPGTRLADEILGAVAAVEARIRVGANILVSRLCTTTANTPLTCSSAESGRAWDSVGLAQVAELVYELLDAHDDTARMASDLACDPSWRAHVAYLRALQRGGRETLARLSLDELHEHGGWSDRRKTSSYRLRRRRAA
jgi:hypothetical protein